jgi:hypothetical protein
MQDDTILMYRVGVQKQGSEGFFLHKGHEITVKGKIVGNKDVWLVGRFVDSAVSISYVCLMQRPNNN